MPTIQSGFELHTTLVFPDRHIIAQGFTVETHSGDIYATQDDGSREYVTRFVRPASLTVPELIMFEPAEQMAVLAGGHGDLTFDVELVDGQIRPSFIDHDGSLWRIPFTDGNVRLTGKPLARGWKMPIRGYDGTVLVRRTVKSDREKRIFHFYGPDDYSDQATGQGTAAALKDASRRLFRVKNYGWIQGYAFHRGTLYTLRGAPRVEDGHWLYDDGRVLPYIERREVPTGRILEPWLIDQLGWSDGQPIDGKVEPEGMTVALVDDLPHLLVGISTGHKGHYSLQIWKKAI